MSRRIERSMTCARCEKTFHGYGRGPNGEKQAYGEAFAYLRAHHCLPLEKPDSLPKISGTDLDAIMGAIRKAMPDVTITRRKV